MKRYPWLRLYHETPIDPKLRMIARDAGQNVATVLAVWVTVLCHAGEREGDQRGHLGGWMDGQCAVILDLPVNVVSGIRQAMEGLLLQEGRIIAWDRRQSCESIERVREHRARRKVEKAALAADVAASDAAAARENGARGVTVVTAGNAMKRSVMVEEKRREDKALGAGVTGLPRSAPPPAGKRVRSAEEEAALLRGSYEAQLRGARAAGNAKAVELALMRLAGLQPPAEAAPAGQAVQDAPPVSTPIPAGTEQAGFEDAAGQAALLPASAVRAGEGDGVQPAGRAAGGDAGRLPTVPLENAGAIVEAIMASVPELRELPERTGVRVRGDGKGMEQADD